MWGLDKSAEASLQLQGPRPQGHRANRYLLRSRATGQKQMIVTAKQGPQSIHSMDLSLSTHPHRLNPRNPLQSTQPTQPTQSTHTRTPVLTPAYTKQQQHGQHLCLQHTAAPQIAPTPDRHWPLNTGCCTTPDLARQTQHPTLALAMPAGRGRGRRRRRRRHSPPVARCQALLGLTVGSYPVPSASRRSQTRNS